MLRRAEEPGGCTGRVEEGLMSPEEEEQTQKRAARYPRGAPDVHPLCFAGAPLGKRKQKEKSKRIS